jgi:hypothetical protein
MVSRIQQRHHERVIPEFRTSESKSIRFRMRQIETSMFPALPSGREDHVFGVNERIAHGWSATLPLLFCGASTLRQTWNLKKIPSGYAVRTKPLARRTQLRG